MLPKLVVCITLLNIHKHTWTLRIIDYPSLQPVLSELPTNNLTSIVSSNQAPNKTYWLELAWHANVCNLASANGYVSLLCLVRCRGAALRWRMEDNNCDLIRPFGAQHKSFFSLFSFLILSPNQFICLDNSTQLNVRKYFRCFQLYRKL